MRNWITLIESVQEQATSLEQLAGMRDEYIINPGTDPDYDQILDQLEMSGEEEAQEINAAFFDDRLAHFHQIAASGSVKVYRCISVRNLAKFIASINKRPLGCSWASDQESASCEYHPEANHEHEIMLVAQAPMTSIHWDTSMMQNFGHPHENEITIDGPVHNLEVFYEGKLVHREAVAQA